jgi:hypothetical protein
MLRSDDQRKLGRLRRALGQKRKNQILPASDAKMRQCLRRRLIPSSDQLMRPGELRACASTLMLSRELNERRALRVRSGFGTSCLQSEMILPHMLAQPGSYSLRHMFMHSR